MPIAVLALAAVLVQAKDNPSIDPREAKPGKVAQWKAADGLPYEYCVPEGYDAEQGANLTLVLHGNGLDHRWTFWNHPAGEFRAGDIVVSPDGTTPHAGTGANEFLGGKQNVERVHALIAELKATWKVRQTFLYGHSQGSFFVFLYAGEHPEDVDGVCGHASGVWNGTRAPKSDRPIAVGFLHGTEDQNVPYGQSWHGLRWYRDEKHLLVHLRTLFDWPHAPSWRQAQNVLAWCEGMTSEDPARVAASLEVLLAPDVPSGTDWSALWAVAERLSGMEQASKEQRERGRTVAAAVDALGQEHLASIEKGLGKQGQLDELSAGPWVGEVIRLLEEFEGVPAVGAFAERHEQELEGQRKAAKKAVESWWSQRDKDPEKAFEAGRLLLEDGFLSAELPQVLAQCKQWVEGDAVKLKAKDRKAFLELASTYEDGRKDGFKDFVQRGGRLKVER